MRLLNPVNRLAKSNAFNSIVKPEKRHQSRGPMFIKSVARRWLNSKGYAVFNSAQPHVYSEDGLATIHNKSFLRNPRFQRAYDRGIKANGADHFMRWRAHVAFWVAKQASRLPGDFVECGVSTGFLASGIMDYLDWNSLNRRYIMFDTWAGLDDRYLSKLRTPSGPIGMVFGSGLQLREAKFQ